MNFREPPVPPLAVVVKPRPGYVKPPNYPGDVGLMQIDLSSAAGDLDDCVEFIKNHLPPVGYDFYIAEVEGDGMIAAVLDRRAYANAPRMIFIQDCSPL